MTSEPPATDSVQGRARQLGGDLRRRRLAVGLTQQALADRIGYDRSYLSQVETGAQIPAEQFVFLCERELSASGDLLSMFRGILAEREARRQEAHAERWRRPRSWSDDRARLPHRRVPELRQRACYANWRPIQ